jgi:polyisoprenoid-binding protein YceI
VRSASSQTDPVRRTFKLILGAVVVVALLVAGLTAWYVFGDHAPAKPKLTACGQPVSGGPTSPNGTWDIAPSRQVYAGYRIKELFGDAVLKHVVVGRTPAVTGHISIANGRIATAVVTADVTKLQSDRAARDTYILDNGLDSSKYPTARFTLSQPIVLQAGAGKGQPLHAEAIGTLLIHGVRRPVTIPFRACWNGPTIDVVGTSPISLSDYNIQAPHTVIAKVDNQGSLEFDLTFVPHTN